MFAEMQAGNHTTVDGAEAADLYQTNGVPPEVFETMAAENNLAFDWDGYRKAMAAHGEVSGKVAHAVMGDKGPVDAIKKVLHHVEFLGYEATEAEAELKFIVAQDQLCDHLQEVGHSETVTLVLDRTPFYGESGGQVGDTGEIVGEGFRFEVTDTQRDAGLILHHGHLKQGELRTGTAVTARVDKSRRQGIRRAHSATHILHHALQKNLGSHAQQQGSKVDQDWLRFDFTNLAPVNAEQLQAVERDSLESVATAAQITAQTLPLAKAREQGAMMLFGEKYPDPVRMVSMGDFSKELCGGIHLDNTSEVGPFEIISEEGVSAGTRRIIALTGEKAKEHAEQTQATLTSAAKLLGVELVAVPEAIRVLAQQVRDLKKQLASGAKKEDTETPPKKTKAVAARTPTYAEVKAALRESARLLNVASLDVPDRVAAMQKDVVDLLAQLEQLAESGDLSADALLEKAETIGETNMIVAETAGANPNLMRQLIDQIRKKGGSNAIFLATAAGDSKVVLVAGVSRDLVERGVSAGDWVKEVAPVVGGGGGGKPDLAQAGGKDPAKLGEALEVARATMRKLLAS
ncbi:MAG TPA: alanine--tRNA ligase-related protein [Pirellulaceae bacterium]|nr:alanine--tRNA ligase-related protein [Pirellulaceae bacterium]